MIKLGKLFKQLNNSKGVTVTEIIMALAVLGIISMPIFAVFSNSVFIEKLTGTQMEINAVMQIAKGEVSQSVKKGVYLYHFENDTLKNDLCPLDAPIDPLYSAPGNETVFFFKLQSGNLASKYKYKVKFINKGTDTQGSFLPTDPVPRTVELLIKLYSADDEKFIRDVKTCIAYTDD